MHRAHAKVKPIQGYLVSWKNPLEYPFNAFSIHENALPESGVYALCDGNAWIYIGEADNMQKKLLEHLNPDSPDYIIETATTFSYETCVPEDRAARLKELEEEFHPQGNLRGTNGR